MGSQHWGSLVYLSLLGAVLVFWFIVHHRQSMGRTLQQVVAWALIFLGVIAAVGIWDDIRTTVRPGQSAVMGGNRIEVPRAFDGHYYLTLAVNGVPVTFLVDTGATDVVMTAEDAGRAGIDLAGLEFVGRANTANGAVRTAPINLDLVALGPIEDRNVRAWVNGGEMDQSLLGMAYLQRWGRIEIGGGALVLTR